MRLVLSETLIQLNPPTFELAKDVACSIYAHGDYKSVSLMGISPAQLYDIIGCALGKGVPEPKDEADRKGYSGLSLDQRQEFNALPPHLDDRAGVDCGAVCAKCNYLRAASAGFHPCSTCGIRHGVPEEPR